jgi:dihydroorotate dehydrogenase (fumarate)
MFNRFYSPDIDIDSMELTSASVLSNPGDYSTAIRWIAIMHKHVSCDLAASTGVYTGRDMVKMILAGASAVQVASVFYKNGVDYAAVMLKDLDAWMDSKAFKSISDFKGMMSQNETENPAAFQRVQFMKYFRGHQR